MQLQLDPLQLERITHRLQQVAQENPRSMSMEGMILQALCLVVNQTAVLKEPRDFFGDVAKFNMKFGLGYHGEPRFLPEDMFKHALSAMREEIQEYEDAVAAGDLISAHDALIDLVYFALGRALLHGFPFREGWDLVQVANMAKQRALPDGSNSKRGFGCDVVKPPGWVGPDHAPLFPPHLIKSNEAQPNNSGGSGLLRQDNAGEVPSEGASDGILQDDADEGVAGHPADV